MTFCPDCATELDDVAAGEPCPGCGGQRRSTNAGAGCAAGTAAVPDVRVVGHSHLTDGSERIDVGSRLYQSSSHAGPDAGHQSFKGRPPHNEDDVAEVCAVLRDALRESGENWSAFQVQDGQANDVDAIADGDAGHLSVQVVRVEQEVWAELGPTGKADRVLTAQDLASAVMTAIEKKARHYPPNQRRELLLALDSIRTPGFAHKQVVDVLNSNHVGQIAQYGFKAVWLVGPTLELTYRLALGPT